MLLCHCSPIAETLQGDIGEMPRHLGGHCAGYCSDGFLQLPGCCWETARLMLGGCRAIARRFGSIGAGQPAEIRRKRHLILIRGWCLTKMNGFPIPESRDNFRSAETIKNAAQVCRLRSAEG